MQRWMRVRGVITKRLPPLPMPDRKFQMFPCIEPRYAPDRQSRIACHSGSADLCRAALVAGLLEAAVFMQHIPGGELSMVNVSASEPDVVRVAEVWSRESAHQASLAPEEINALIKRNMPLIAGSERIEIVPIGGKGLPTDACRFKRSSIVMVRKAAATVGEPCSSCARFRRCSVSSLSGEG